jgi:hypothetical protein
MAQIIDGKSRAKQIRETIKNEVQALKAKGINPKLTVVLVGDDPASHWPHGCWSCISYLNHSRADISPGTCTPDIPPQSLLSEEGKTGRA